MSTSTGSTSRGRSESDRVLIFDTTLRDGEQSPGISLNKTEKLEIAHQLARLGVDVIEAGFPITSPGDFESVQAIAREVEGPVICGLARTVSQDIEAVWNAVRDAQRPRIHMVIATSDIHIKHKLQTTREDVKGQVRAAVAQAQTAMPLDIHREMALRHELTEHRVPFALAEFGADAECFESIMLQPDDALGRVAEEDVDEMVRTEALTRAVDGR